MKLLFIGGTGLISSACAELAVQRGHSLTLVNRSVSKKYSVPDGANVVTTDIHDEGQHLAEALKGQSYDAVVDFLAFTVKDIERDLGLFRGRVGQFVFISSASAYQRPPQRYVITEETLLENPFWQYSRDKIACERLLMEAYRKDGFPVTVVRPSLTYGPSQIPFCVGSWAYPWTIMHRMMQGKKIVVPGDGTSLWVLTWNMDFAKGLVGLLGKPEAIGEAYHITSDEVLTWNEVYIEAFRALGLTSNILHVPTDVIEAYWPHAHGSLLGDKIHSVVFDNSKIKRTVPDYQCEVNWAEGVRRAIAWHQAHQAFQAVDVEMERVLDNIVVAMEPALPQHQR